MRATVAQTALARSVAPLARAAGQAASLTGMLVTASGGTLSMRVTDGTSSTMYSCPAHVEEDGKAVVSAPTLASLVKAMPDTSVTLESRDLSVVVGYGRSNARLNGIDPVDFPEFPDNEMAMAAVVDGSRFRQMAGVACKTTYRELDKPSIRGVLVGVRDGRLTMQASDGYRVVLMGTGCMSADGEASANVPSESLKAFAAMAEKEVVIGFSNTRLTLMSGNCHMVTNLVSKPFPAIGELMAAGTDGAASVVTDELREALQRVEAMTKEDQRVTFSTRDGEMVITGSSRMEGAIREFVPMDYDGTPRSATVNVRFAIAALEPATDEVLVRLGPDPMQPVMFRSYGDVDSTFVVMPMRR